MKRSAKHVRGRRANPVVVPELPRLITAKFIDGPLEGRTLQIPDGDYKAVGPVGNPFWMYSYAGKDGRTQLFSKLPPQHAIRKAILWYVGKFGKDPRAERAAIRPIPAKRTGLSHHGRGARLRLAKRRAALGTA